MIEYTFALSDEVDRLRDALAKIDAELRASGNQCTHYVGCEADHLLCKIGRIIDDALGATP